MKFFNKKRSDHSIGSIVRSICDACDSVLSIYAYKRIEFLKDYFEEDEKGSYIPKKINIKRGDVSKSFSLLGLVYQDVPVADQIEIKFKIAMKDLVPTQRALAEHEHQKDKHVPISDTSCEIVKVKKKNVCDVKMTFKLKEDDENTRRLIEFIDN